MKKIFLTIILLILIGCSLRNYGNSDFERDFLLIGHHKNELIAQRGIPDKTYKIDENNEVFEYYLGSQSNFSSNGNFYNSFGQPNYVSYGSITTNQLSRTFYIKNNIIVHIKG